MNHPSKVLIKEWIDNADADFSVASTLYKRRNKKFYFAIAFHCQQSIEKYIKALLIGHKIDFPKIHDLILLLNLLKDKDPFLNGIKNELNILNPFAVWFRYPGEEIGFSEIKEVMQVAKRVRKILKKRLGEFI